MLREIYPRNHARYASLPLLGPYLDGFVGWLRNQGYPLLPILARIRAAARLDALLSERGVRHPGELTASDLMGFRPACSRDDMYLTALVRSLAAYFADEGLLAPPVSTATDRLVSAYRCELENVRGLAESTVHHHIATVVEFLSHLRYDGTAGQLLDLDRGDIEGYLRVVGPRRARASLQHTVAHLRSFLRFLSSQGFAPANVHSEIDSPRVYRGERLPRSLPWETVSALLKSIDRLSAMGRRDYAMLLLVATYGLRCCEVVSLELDHIDWRRDKIRVPRSKVRSPLLLPLTTQVGAAILEHIRRDRPSLPQRQIFLRVRAPAGTLKPTALTEIFQRCVGRSGLPIPFQGPHCIRHSLAVHLLRQGTPLKTIGDLLGHRSVESTGVYLRLHVEELREVTLQLPEEARP